VTHRFSRRAGRRTDDGADPNLVAVLAILAAQPLSAWFDTEYTDGVTIESDAGTDRMTEIESRPISGQLQYSVPPVALSVAPALDVTANNKRVLSFTGGRYMGGLCSLAASFAGVATFTAVSLGSRSVGGSAIIRWSFGDSSGVDNRVTELSSSGNLDNRNRAVAAGNTSNLGAALANGDVRVFSTTYNATSYSTWMDGVLSINAAANTRSPTALDELWFGAQRAAGVITSFWRGMGGPIAICSGVLGTTDRQALESSFGAYYGHPL